MPDLLDTKITLTLRDLRTAVELAEAFDRETAIHNLIANQPAENQPLLVAVLLPSR